ncbi:N-acetylglucosamine-6-phosphate deacetylase [Propionispora sp. 2/2-37]|uniref:N-acetylglucosamine-6-phosphate deacetylase n=1 Tax=Propionispora sp. 2/2-37 TaxID=1677858 RepID=UPI0006BB8CA6|nr:N-acetylglucosamine-6-phosphate deacetylase [Propionispora sp. 2/2-37]CUH95131.1 N-acetylglucosamine-6-phosphate deacetylase [Propionispora sp. 2/2-37]
MDTSHYAITANKIVLENRIIENGAVVVNNGLIEAIVDSKSRLNVGCVWDFSAMEIWPGLIDTHIHGANGYDVMAADFTAVNEVSKFLARKGVTSFVPTVMTAPVDQMQKALQNIHACTGQVEGAEILGAYLEGPYLAASHRGAHPQDSLRPVEVKEVDEFIKAAAHSIVTVALAPESKNSVTLIRHLVRQGIHVALGHTGATYEEMGSAFAAGADIAVHTYNGMQGLHHRKPGAVGAILTNDRVYAELIADFIHVHPAAIDILFHCKPKDKIILISDAMAAAGLPDGEYTLGTIPVIVRDTIARAPNGSLAGSTTNLLNSVAALINKMAVDPVDAINMASRNPARLLGLERQIGTIQEGKKANLAIVDTKFQVAMTLVNGKVVYQS